jgi:SAM-dependent methyltransferase
MENKGRKMKTNDNKIKQAVRKRYSRFAREGTSCCPTVGSYSSAMTEQAKRIGYSKKELGKIPEEAVMGLGCGNPTALADLKEGEIVLDLGAGAGIDVFLAADKVGAKGRVIGVDMTRAMVEKANKTAKKHGYKNVEFRLGDIEKLPVEDGSVDVIISNCVINLSPDKLRVYKEAHRVLKANGRLLVSDLVTEGELPEAIRKSFDAWAGCIAGAMEKGKYLETIRKAGFRDVRIVSQSTFHETGLHRTLAGKITSVKVSARK